MNFRKQQREHPPIHIDGTAVEKVERFKFLGVHITDKLKWSTHTDSVVKKAQQYLLNLRRLKKFGLSLQRVVRSAQLIKLGANYLPSMTPTAPDVTGRPKRSSRTSTT